MPVVNKMELGRELSKTVIQINRVIEDVRQQAGEMEIEAAKLRDSNGNWVMIPLLAAKAQSLHALALINQKEK